MAPGSNFDVLITKFANLIQVAIHPAAPKCVGRLRQNPTLGCHLRQNPPFLGLFIATWFDLFCWLQQRCFYPACSIA